jgi:peptidoglycan/LPS O-acetylase OafA/YrhL
VALLTAVLIAASSHPQARLTSAVLGWEPLRWIGLRSYGLYLWHWPVFLLAQTFVDPASAGWATLLAQLALVLLLTEASYRMVELPFRQAGTTSGWQVARQRARAALQALAPVAVTRPHVVPLPSALRHVPTLSPEMFNAEAQRRRAAEVKSS